MTARTETRPAGNPRSAGRKALAAAVVLPPVLIAIGQVALGALAAVAVVAVVAVVLRARLARYADRRRRRGHQGPASWAELRRRAFRPQDGGIPICTVTRGRTR